VRLSQNTLTGLAPGVALPSYDRGAQACGIVHIGLGAFARAHLAYYTDAAMTCGDRDWMITGVSLRSPDVAEQLNPQNGLYLVAERSAGGTVYRLNGAITRVLVAPHQPEAVVDVLAAPSTRIVSFTVTEKGYCRTGSGSLDMALAQLGSFYPLLAAALRRRCDAGLAGLTLLSCDNLAANGNVLEGLVTEYLAATDPGLSSWFAQNCTCPCAMVDRIVPATRDADRSEAEQAAGVREEALTVTEPFSQWVIEDCFANGRPGWDRVGAQLVDDVAPYEAAKLRLLNGAHSLLAYCGLEAGYETVDQAIADPRLRALVMQLMLREAAPTVAAAPGQDLAAYCASLIQRFENPALDHRLIQIAMDGSQKLPQRWLGILAERKAARLASPAIFAGLTAWLLHVRGTVRQVDDPLASELMAAWANGANGELIARILGANGIVASCWQPDEADTAQIVEDLLRGIAR